MHPFRIYSFLIVFTLLLFPGSLFAQEGFVAETVEASIVSISLEEIMDGGVHRYVFDAETDSGEILTIDTTDSFVFGVGYRLKVGDDVSLRSIQTNDGVMFYLDDVHREPGLFFIIAIFTILTLLVGLMRGFLSLIGLAVTLIILLFGLFPAILGGVDPITASVVASAVILGVNMHLSHGFKKKTFYAYLSTLGGLSLVLVFTKLFISIARLSGIASEEGALLFWSTDPVQIPVGVLAAGIILGASGVLDDIAITQSEVIDELLISNPNTTRKELFTKGMRIGRHHIASTVNTLILVYAGAALPGLLLYMNQAGGYQAFLNNELIAEEIVRTLAGTCALVLTVPLSTWFATLHHKVIDKDTIKT